MYVIHIPEGSWKATTLDELSNFIGCHFEIDTAWMKFRSGETSIASPCERYELQKVDGRTVRDIPEAWDPTSL